MPIARWSVVGLVVGLALMSTGCAFLDDFDDFKADSDAAVAGSGGIGGSGGTGGVGGTGGTGGSGGTGGVGGTGGTGGSGGTGGVGGTGGSGGSQDAGDQDAMIDAGQDANIDAGEDAGSDAAIDLCDGVTCAAMACKQAGVCNPSNGQCEYDNVDDGMACASDDIPCTVDACDNGVCTHVLRDCSSLDGPCVDGVCNTATGACAAIAKVNNTICSDDNLCTGTGGVDTCQDGSCVPGTPRNCSSLDAACLVGVCDPANGNCRADNRPSTTSCNDGNACTGTDHCMAGTCIGTPLNAGSCTDNNACTTGDHCVAGTCVPGPAVDCNTQCTTATCNPSTGMCGAATDRSTNLDCSDDDVCDEFANAACVTNACGSSGQYNCIASWEDDGYCDCGCQFADRVDCGLDPVVCDYYGAEGGGDCEPEWYGDGDCDCTCNFGEIADLIDCGVSPDCDNDRTVQYETGNCPPSMDGDGPCDCGCKFGPPGNPRADSDCPI